MGKKKFKKNNKKAEQQLESAERVSRLMEMYQSGEISDEEFIELVNCKDAAEETVIENDITDMISSALGYDRSNVRSIDQIKAQVHDDDHPETIYQELGGYEPTNEIKAGTSNPITDMMYATNKDDRSDISDLEAKLMVDEMKTSGSVTPSITTAPIEKESIVIPGVTDYSLPEDQDPASLITNDGMVFTPNDDYFGYNVVSENESRPMPEIVLADPDDEMVVIINKDMGMKVTMDLFGGYSDQPFDASLVGLEPEEFDEYIKCALLMLSGNCIIAPYTNADMRSLVSSVTSLNKSKFIIFYVHYKEAGLDPFYIMYHWTDAMENEYRQLMEWLQSEKLTLLFTSSLVDLVTNSAMFPLLEEPRRSKYITWSDDEEISEFVDAVNSDPQTTFGIVHNVDEFHSNCAEYSLDEIIGHMYGLAEGISEIPAYELGDCPDESITQNDECEKVQSAEEAPEEATVTVTTEQTVTTATSVEVSLNGDNPEKETIEMDGDIEVDEVEDTESIQLNTSNEVENSASSFVMKPIVK